MGIDDVTIDEVVDSISGTQVILYGNNFTKWSRVFVNDTKVTTYFSGADCLIIPKDVVKNGDTITLATTLGTRRYSVYSVRKVSVNDVSVLNPSDENMVTLVTCVMNQPQYRWCVQARHK